MLMSVNNIALFERNKRILFAHTINRTTFASNKEFKCNLLKRKVKTNGNINGFSRSCNHDCTGN